CAPETTDGRDGFIHPIHVEGRTERTVVKFLLRDFELKGLADKGKILRGLCRGLQASEPRARVRCKLRKQYRNMAYWLRKDCARLSWRGRRSWRRDSSPMITSSAAGPMAHA